MEGGGGGSAEEDRAGSGIPKELGMEEMRKISQRLCDKLLSSK